MYIMSSCCFNYSILLRKLLNQSLDVLKPLENLSCDIYGLLNEVYC